MCASFVMEKNGSSRGKNDFGLHEMREAQVWLKSNSLVEVRVRCALSPLSRQQTASHQTNMKQAWHNIAQPRYGRRMQPLEGEVVEVEEEGEGQYAGVWRNIPFITHTFTYRLYGHPVLT